MGTISTAKVVKTPTGKNYISFWTSVEVETEADVHVDINLDDVIDDIIEALDPLQVEQIINKAGLINKSPQLESESLKRHLCDLAGIGYQCSMDQLMRALFEKL